MNKPPKAIILGAGGESVTAGRPDPVPRSLLEDESGRRVLDWVIDSFRQAGIQHIVFVGGYRIEEIGEEYPDLEFIYNPDWRQYGVLTSLYHARHELTDATLITYGDVVFRSGVAARVIQSATESGITVAMDAGYHPDPGQRETLRKNLIALRDGHVEDIGILSANAPDAAEFTGLLHLDSATANGIRTFLDEEFPQLGSAPFEQSDDIRQAFLTDLIRHVRRQGVTVRGVDIGSDWAEIEAPDSLARFVLGTKSETLERLARMIKRGRFCEQFVCSVGEWQRNREAVLDTIQATFSPHPLVVRSSALAEDSWQESMAGAFESVLDIDSEDRPAVVAAMDRVVASYGKHTDAANPENQLLVQRMVQNVVLHGVAFTRDLQTDAPYYVINYDDQSDRTDTVTSGQSSGIKTQVISRAHTRYLQHPSLQKVLDVVQELEAVTGSGALDIEFAMDRADHVYILQVRPLTVTGPTDVQADRAVAHFIDRAAAQFTAARAPQPGVYGSDTVWGDMPDWNPAEMIGPHPRPLAMSLYQYLITDSAWREARGRIGYRNPAVTRLMYGLAGHPYIDVRASFNNLIPADVSADVAEKLLDIYIRRLQQHPDRHDKVEFEVLVTCMDFDVERQGEALRADGLDEAGWTHLREALRGMTQRIIAGHVEPMDELVAQFQGLTQRREQLLELAARSPESIPVCIERLLKDCQQSGVIPFSILARYAFIANSCLRSLTQRGVCTQAELDEWLNQVESVATELIADLDAVTAGGLELDQFLERYGHLRPGTYDITSQTYREAPEVYFSASGTGHDESDSSAKVSSAPQKTSIESRHVDVQALIDEVGFQFTADTFLRFCRRAISLREWGKFEFTKSVSAVLSLLAQWGGSHGISREDCAYLTVSDILRWATDQRFKSPATELAESVERGRHEFQAGGRVRMPHLLRDATDLYVIELAASRPNFVTGRKVSGRLIELTTGTPPEPLQGKLVLIESADPGYDWIFSHQIAGLITRYGGAASHMTIRASEFNVPAAIGCGEALYAQLQQAKFVELDCAGKLIRIL